MEITPAKDNLEVTGVSRSGRVRKKSSKLLDFQSLDEIEAKSKRNNGATKTSTPINKQQHLPPLISYTPEMNSPPLNVKIEPPLDIDGIDGTDEDMDDGIDGPGNSGHSDDIDTSGGESMDDGDNDGLFIDTTVRKSAYMAEKSKKKEVIFKDGKLVYGGKPQRKDKGKSRFTAYMLWAKDIRKEMIFSNPELDFATISRRLGEMWSNVPGNEKYNWRRRAKRLAAKAKSKDKDPKLIMLERSKGAVQSKFLNRSNAPASTPTPTTPSSYRNSKRQTSESSTSTAHVTPSHGHNNSKQTKHSPTLNKLLGTSPMDVAAHLTLLGDSLTIIGERLKEHEGQITVSGSLSVLLDSLLCSIAPLMCLTPLIPVVGPQLNDLKDNMSETLDNIAYVMPGL